MQINKQSGISPYASVEVVGKTLYADAASTFGRSSARLFR